MTEPTPNASVAFDELYAKLEEVTHRLEEGNLGLEASVSLYEEGAGLVLQLRGILTNAELRIRNVQGRLSGQATDEPTADEPATDDQFVYVDTVSFDDDEFADSDGD